jgi:hypothetical protein
MNLVGVEPRLSYLEWKVENGGGGGPTGEFWKFDEGVLSPTSDVSSVTAPSVSTSSRILDGDTFSGNIQVPCFSDFSSQFSVLNEKITIPEYVPVSGAHTSIDNADDAITLTSNPETLITQCRLGNGDMNLSVRTDSSDVNSFIYMNHESLNIQASRKGKNDCRISVVNWDDTSEIEINADSVRFFLGTPSQQKNIRGFAADTVDADKWLSHQLIDAKLVYDWVKSVFTTLCTDNPNIKNPFPSK